MLFLMPSIGEVRAKQISFVIALILMLLIATAGIKWMRASGGRQLLLIGLFWAVLTFCFELLLGVIVTDLRWEAFAADYDLIRGGLMGLGLLYLMFLPMIANRLRRAL